MSGPDRPARGVSPEEIRSAEEDRGRDVDVLAVHRQAFREPGDPGEGAEPGPWWFWAASVAALVFGGFYMGRYTGVFAGEEAVHAQAVQEVHRAGAPSEPEEQASGAGVFSSHCAACHQANGRGLPGVFPPLAGSQFINGDSARLARLVLHGLTGPVTVGGATFNGAMPAWGDQLTDTEIAAVLTYVRSSFGNSSAGVSAGLVSSERAATASRTAPWTVPELGP
jgi:mono/diheme cytochrome c family protein